MVYTAILKYLSFKQNFMNVKNLLDNQVATYAVLKYSDELPESVYLAAVEELSWYLNEITDERLLELVLNSYHPGGNNVRTFKNS